MVKPLGAFGATPPAQPLITEWEGVEDALPQECVVPWHSSELVALGALTLRCQCGGGPAQQRKTRLPSASSTECQVPWHSVVDAVRWGPAHP